MTPTNFKKKKLIWNLDIYSACAGRSSFEIVKLFRRDWSVAFDQQLYSILSFDKARAPESERANEIELK